MSKKKEYLIAALILLCGVVLSVGILLTAYLRRSGGRTSDAPKAEPIEITFLDEKGNLIEKRRVESGTSVIPPTVSKEGHFLKDWDKFLLQVVSPMEVTPYFEPVEGVKNAVYADAVYAKTNQPVTLKVCLGGDVDAKSFRIEAEYDAELLLLKKGNALLDGIKFTQKKENGIGTAIITYQGEKTLDVATALAELVFEVQVPGDYKTTVTFATKEIEVLNRDEHSDSTAYETDIYLFQ